MKKHKTNKLFQTILVFVMAITLAVIPVSTSYAADYTYTSNGRSMTLEVVDGKTTLTADSNIHILTNRLIAADAGFDSEGTTWILYKNGSIYWWNYDLEKSISPIVLHKLYKGNSAVFAQNFILSSDGKTIVGYKTSDGTTGSLPNLTELKKLLSTDSSNTNSGSSSTDSGNANNGSSSTNSGNANSGSSSTNSGNVNSGSSSTNSGNINSGSSSTNSGNANSGSSSTDSNNTTNSSTSTNNSTITQNNSTTNNNSTATTKPTSCKKTKKATKVITKRTSYCLYSGSRKLSSFSLNKKGILSWRGWKTKKVKEAGWIKNSKSLIYITNKGSVKVLNFTNMKSKTILKKGASNLNYDSNGFAKWVVKKSGGRFKVTKY